ncbi:type II secretion system secretin GspD [Thiomicrospira sp.]|uniref:type II secretion system secretin GspD n=1 Tax=Thiomicrospira sp. TaxID=935 RepID=UPI0025DC3975|nr:type II secretion system secretin GspD [Thiomicrospira sp.]
MSLVLLTPGLVVANEPTLKQNFRDAEIATVIEAVAKATGKNFIIDPRVRGKVTLIAPEAMSADALYQTLLAIINVHGFVAVPSGDVIKVIPANLARDQLPYARAQDKGEAWVTEVVKVTHVEASKLVAILRPLVAREGHLVAMADSNRLIVTDTVDGIDRIKAILKQVDIRADTDYEVIEVKHSPAEAIVKTLKALQPQGQTNVAKVTFDERSNRIVLSGDEQSRLMLRVLVAELDIPLSQDGSVQVVYLRYAKALDLVPILEKMATNRSMVEGASSEAGAAESLATSLDEKSLKERVSIVADERMNALVISAPPAILTGLRSVVKQLDIRRAQVLIEAIIVEISQSKQAELGVEWAAAGPSGVGMINFSGTIPTILGNAGNPAAQAQAIGQGVTAGFGQVNSSNQGWGALVRALSGDSEANILSTPTLLTLDNEEAEIIVGREVPFQTGSYSSSANSGTNPFTTIERKSVGLKLKVRPQINEGNEIQLEIDQEISDVLPKSDAVDLETSKRQLKTNVIVGDGNMIVLGGLLSERETEVARRVPGLGSIPWLGALFRYQESRREKVNLMVFLRPVIVRDNLMSDYYSRQKYNHIYEEQAQMLEEDSGLLRGLRPQMPTVDEWDQRNQKPNEALSRQVSEAPPTPESQNPPQAEKSEPKKDNQHRRRDSSLEVLGF